MGGWVGTQDLLNPLLLSQLQILQLQCPHTIQTFLQRGDASLPLGISDHTGQLQEKGQGLLV